MTLFGNCSVFLTRNALFSYSDTSHPIMNLTSDWIIQGDQEVLEHGLYWVKLNPILVREHLSYPVPANSLQWIQLTVIHFDIHKKAAFMNVKHWIQKCVLLAFMNSIFLHDWKLCANVMRASFGFKIFELMHEYCGII